MLLDHFSTYLTIKRQTKIAISSFSVQTRHFPNNLITGEFFGFYPDFR